MKPTLFREDGTKPCKTCGEFKTADAYNIDRSTMSGYNYTCRACHQIARDARKAAKRKVSLQKSDQKACSQCKVSKNHSEFRMVKKRNSDDRVVSSWCKPCESLKHKQWARDNPEKNKERNRRAQARLTAEQKAEYARRSKKWREDNAEELRMKSSQYYLDNKEVLKQNIRAWQKANPDKVRVFRHSRRAKLKAVPHAPFTGVQLEQKMAYWGNKCYICGGPEEAVDHVKPIFHNGPHMLANFRPICHSCNGRKAHQWPFDVRNPVFIWPIAAA